MKILLFSDSHRNVFNMKNVIERFKNEISLIVHLGDYVSDFKEITKHIYEIPCISVKGNNDFFEPNEQEEYIYNLNGINCLFTHGHRYGVKTGLNRLAEHAFQSKAKIVAFGHTHEPLVKQIFDTLYINPGTIGGYSSGLPTFATVNVEKGNLVSAVVYEYNSTKNEIVVRETI